MLMTKQLALKDIHLREKTETNAMKLLLIMEVGFLCILQIMLHILGERTLNLSI